MYTPDTGSTTVDAVRGLSLELLCLGVGEVGGFKSS
jgi:hypothetical protein